MSRNDVCIDRRTQSLQSVIYGVFRPRRRESRREGDDQRFLVDWHDSGIFYVALAILVMSCMDALFTLKLLAMGGEELNPAMKVLIEADTLTFLLVKFGLTASGVFFLIAAERIHLFGFIQVRRILEGICVMYACLMIYEIYLLVAHASATIY